MYYAVRFKIEDSALHENEEGYDLIKNFDGEIVGKTEDEAETIIGHVRGSRVALDEACDRRIGLYNLFDLDGELLDFYESMFDPATDDIRENLGLDGFGDMLCIHLIEINPEYRGQNLGLLTLLQTIKTFGGGCSVAAIKPFPPQFSQKVNEESRDEFGKCQKKLQKYWQQFGFRRVGRTEYYYYDLRRPLPRQTKLVEAQRS